MWLTVFWRGALPLLLAVLASAQGQQIDPADLAAYRQYDSLRKNSDEEAGRFLALHWAAADKRDYALLTRLRSLAGKDDLRTRREIASLVSSDYPNLIATGRLPHMARLAAFSPDGERVVTLQAGTLQWWNAPTLVPIGAATPVEGEPVALTIAPDGRVVMAFTTGSSTVLRASDGAALGAPLATPEPLSAIALSPDGRMVVTADDHGRLRRYQLETGAAVGHTMNFPEGIAAVAFLDGKSVAVASDDGAMQSLQFDQEAAGSPTAIPRFAMALSLHGSTRTLLTRDGEEGIRVWNMPAGSTPAPSPGPPIRVGAATISPAASAVVTVHDQIATLWTGPDSPLELGSATEAFMSPDGKTVFTYDGPIGRFWSAADGKPADAPAQMDYDILSAAFSANGKFVLAAGVGDDKGEARLWHADNGAPAGAPIRQPAGVTMAIALSHDGRTAVTGSTDGIARMWRTDTGALLGRFRHGQPIDLVAISPDGQTLVTSTSGDATRLWRVSGQMIARLPFVGPIINLEFSPDSKTFLIATIGDAHLYRTLDATRIAGGCEFGDTVMDAAFSPDGSHVVLRTSQWFYLWEPLRNGVQAAIYAPGIAGGSVRFLNPSGGRVEGVAVQLRDAMGGFRVLDFDSPDAAPIAGDPARLLAEWERKLDLTFDSLGHIVPRLR